MSNMLKPLKSKNVFKMKGKVWLYPTEKAAWHFVTLPKKQSVQIKKLFGVLERGWGSLPVNVTVGKTRWKTSIFPDRKAGAYLLPLKTDVREKEKIKSGDTIAFLIELII